MPPYFLARITSPIMRWIILERRIIMLTLAEKIAMGIYVGEIAIGAYLFHIGKKMSNKKMEAIYGTSDMDKITRMSKEEFDEKWNNR